MGSILAKNLIDESGVKPSQITVIEKSDQNKIKGFKYAKNASALKNYQADLVFLAIKPQGCEQILQEFFTSKPFHEKTIFISILAGKKIAFFENIFGKNAKIIRSMPNLPIQDSQGVFAYFANKNITNTEIKNLQKIFNGFGNSIELKNEKLFDAITAIFGSGPAYIFYLQQIFTEIAIDCGISKDEASNLIETLFLGSSLMSCNSALNFKELEESVTSKGGTTAAALEILQKNSALKNIFREAIEAAIDRSQELGN